MASAPRAWAGLPRTFLRAVFPTYLAAKAERMGCGRLGRGRIAIHLP